MRSLLDTRIIQAGLFCLAIWTILGITTGFIHPSDMSLYGAFQNDIDTCLATSTGQSSIDHTDYDINDSSDEMNTCFSQVIQNNPQYSKLHLESPESQLVGLREDGFAAWLCMEQAGYERKTPIPMSGPSGYPLRIAAGHFAVGSDQADLEAFYQTASECTGSPLDAFRGPDGALLAEKADGNTCTEHTHDDWSHSHGCFSVDHYPSGLLRKTNS